MFQQLPTRSPIRMAVTVSVAAALLGALAAGAWALASPSTVLADHGLPHGTILARGGFVEATDIKIKSTLGGVRRVMNVRGSGDAIVQNVTIEPGGQTGWHSHHGPVIVVVAAGTMTLYQADDPTCSGETYTVGDAFVDPGQGNVHNARNLGADGVQLLATYFDVPPGAGPAIPHANPGTCTGF